MKHNSIPLLTLCAAAFVLVAADRVLAADDQASSSSKTEPFEVVLYPILVQAPIFGAEVDLPSLPGGGGGSGGGGGAASRSASPTLDRSDTAGLPPPP